MPITRIVSGMCRAHPFDRAVGRCASCAHVFCEDCLVDPRLVTRQHYCIPCAVTAAGVRRTARRNKAPAAAAHSGRVAVGFLVLAGVAGTATSLAIAFT